MVLYKNAPIVRNKLQSTCIFHRGFLFFCKKIQQFHLFSFLFKNLSRNIFLLNTLVQVPVMLQIQLRILTQHFKFLLTNQLPGTSKDRVTRILTPNCFRQTNQSGLQIREKQFQTPRCHGHHWVWPRISLRNRNYMISENHEKLDTKIS